MGFYGSVKGYYSTTEACEDACTKDTFDDCGDGSCWSIECVPLFAGFPDTLVPTCTNRPGNGVECDNPISHYHATAPVTSSFSNPGRYGCEDFRNKRLEDMVAYCGTACGDGCKADLKDGCPKDDEDDPCDFISICFIYFKIRNLNKIINRISMNLKS